MPFVVRYLAGLRAGKIVLWCYLAWYLVVAARYFDPAPSIWINSLGISAVIGVALVLSTGGLRGADRWQIFRLFLMPFCVSSFSSLIKGRGFFLIVPPQPVELAACVGACVFVLLLVFAARVVCRPVQTQGPA